jgi:hypothetical protein
VPAGGDGRSAGSVPGLPPQLSAFPGNDGGEFAHPRVDHDHGGEPVLLCRDVVIDTWRESHPYEQQAGPMPCYGAWPNERVDVFHGCMDTGLRP